MFQFTLLLFSLCISSTNQTSKLRMNRFLSAFHQQPLHSTFTGSAQTYIHMEYHRNNVMSDFRLWLSTIFPLLLFIYLFLQCNGSKWKYFIPIFGIGTMIQSQSTAPLKPTELYDFHLLLPLFTLFHGQWRHDNVDKNWKISGSQR